MVRPNCFFCVTGTCCFFACACLWPSFTIFHLHILFNHLVSLTDFTRICVSLCFMDVSGVVVVFNWFFGCRPTSVSLAFLRKVPLDHMTPPVSLRMRGWCLRVGTNNWMSKHICPYLVVVFFEGKHGDCQHLSPLWKVAVGRYVLPNVRSSWRCRSFCHRKTLWTPSSRALGNRFAVRWWDGFWQTSQINIEICG